MSVYDIAEEFHFHLCTYRHERDQNGEYLSWGHCCEAFGMRGSNVCFQQKIQPFVHDMNANALSTGGASR
jgi:hypothetical protein